MAVFTNVYGLTSACDTLFPQIFGGEDKKKLGIVLQKGLNKFSLSNYMPLKTITKSKKFL